MLDAYVAWGTQTVAWVQSFRSPALDTAFALASLLGDHRLLFLLASLAFWCMDKRLGFSLVIVFLASAYTNSVLKELLAVPRPAGPGIEALGVNGGYALPSGHAQNASSAWGYWGLWLRHRWAWGAVALILALVAASRVYLGLHYPADVVAGVVIGGLVLILFLRAQAWLTPRLASWPVAGRLALAVGPAVLLALAAPSENALAASGALLGISAGWVLEERYLGMEVSGAWWQYGGRLLLGGAGLGALIGLEAVLEGAPGLDFLAPVALGVWITLGAPALFRLIGLARRTEGILVVR